jgi:hypothetical protein
MDPALNAVIGPWGQWGIVGSVVIALGVVCFMQWSHIKAQSAAHLADVKAYGDKYAELLLENNKTMTALASAIERIGDKIK